MKTLQDLAMHLSAVCDQADLVRLRKMPEAEFVMLLALHGAEEFATEAFLKSPAADVDEATLAAFVQAVMKGGKP